MNKISREILLVIKDLVGYVQAAPKLPLSVYTRVLFATKVLVAVLLP